MSDLIDHDLVERLKIGECCVENNEDAAEHIGILGDEIERLHEAAQEMRDRYSAKCVEIERLTADCRTQNECIADQHDTIRSLTAENKLLRDLLTKIRTSRLQKFDAWEWLMVEIDAAVEGDKT